MKKGVLIVLGLFMMVSTVEAKKGDNLPNRFRVDYNYSDAVNFFERGIEFFIFTNGDFDFDTSYNNRGVNIRRDFRGRIRNVGNVFINYDRRGNVTRIGNIFIRYYNGRLTNVGNLRVRYDRWNYPVFYGNVRDFYYNNGVRFNINFGDVFNYNDAYFYRNDFRRNYSQFREDRNFYYYKASPNANIGKRSKIIRRRKAISNSRNNNKTKRSNNYSYRKNDRKTNTKRNSSSNRRADTTNKSTRNSETSVKTKRNSTNSYRKSNTNKSKRGKITYRRRN